MFLDLKYNPSQIYRLLKYIQNIEAFGISEINKLKVLDLGLGHFLIKVH